MQSAGKIKAKINNLNYRQVFIICLAAIIIFSTLSPVGPNDLSRYLNIVSIAKKGSLIIDEELQKFDTMDKLFINGHFYSDKPPLFAITFSPVYYAAKLLNIPVYNKYLYKFSIILIPGIFFAFAMSLFYKEYAVNFEREKWLLLLLIFATPYYVFNRVLMSHALVGSMLYISFYFIRKKSRGLFMPLAGILSGLAMTYDHGAIFIFFSFSLYLLLRKKMKDLILLISFSLLPVSAHVAIVYQLSGSILPLNMHTEFFDYPGSVWFNSGELTGGLKHTTIQSLSGYITALLFASPGYQSKGLFLTAPILIFGFIQMIREARAIKLEAISLLSGIFLLFAYYALFSVASGGDYVVRWFIIFMPLCLPYTAGFYEAGCVLYMPLSLSRLPFISKAYGPSCRNIKVRGWFNFALIISLSISVLYSFISWLSGGFTPLF